MRLLISLIIALQVAAASSGTVTTGSSLLWNSQSSNILFSSDAEIVKLYPKVCKASKDGNKCIDTQRVLDLIESEGQYEK